MGRVGNGIARRTNSYDTDLIGTIAVLSRILSNPNTDYRKRSVTDLFWFLGIFAAYLFLTQWLLPKLGVLT